MFLKWDYDSDESSVESFSRAVSSAQQPISDLAHELRAFGVEANDDLSLERPEFGEWSHELRAFGIEANNDLCLKWPESGEQSHCSFQSSLGWIEDDLRSHEIAEDVRRKEKMVEDGR